MANEHCPAFDAHGRIHLCALSQQHSPAPFSNLVAAVICRRNCFAGQVDRLPGLSAGDGGEVSVARRRRWRGAQISIRERGRCSICTSIRSVVSQFPEPSTPMLPTHTLLPIQLLAHTLCGLGLRCVGAPTNTVHHPQAGAQKRCRYLLVNGDAMRRGPKRICVHTFCCPADNSGTTLFAGPRHRGSKFPRGCS